ncbi:hypothetical protein AVEN_178256-2 [Araneus ventricosus]|uniref:Uncharacterized protein n=1 Tax=Araneus ventricosus TaxID=182803 RepID=A0A4Y2LAT8_ARAVE|nr:hypothetical protein AVEN_178256-2 [Araneus ventricosus]
MLDWKSMLLKSFYCLAKQRLSSPIRMSSFSRDPHLNAPTGLVMDLKIAEPWLKDVGFSQKLHRTVDSSCSLGDIYTGANLSRCKAWRT